MSVEITFDKIPAGYAESSVRGGGKVMVSLTGFYCDLVHLIHFPFSPQAAFARLLALMRLFRSPVHDSLCRWITPEL